MLECVKGAAAHHIAILGCQRAAVAIENRSPVSELEGRRNASLSGRCGQNQFFLRFFESYSCPPGSIISKPDRKSLLIRLPTGSQLQGIR
jgi:hypothetical protein